MRMILQAVHVLATRDHVFPVSAVAKEKYGKSSTKRTQKNPAHRHAVARCAGVLAMQPNEGEHTTVRDPDRPSEANTPGANAKLDVRLTSKRYAHCRLRFTGGPSTTTWESPGHWRKAAQEG